MENQTRYDLNAAVENWRNELAAQPNFASDDRRELETHLRDAIAGFQQRGLNDEESFWLARRRVGQPQQLCEEFMKTDPAKVWRERAFWIVLVLAAFQLWNNVCPYLPGKLPHFIIRPVIINPSQNPSWTPSEPPFWLMHGTLFTIIYPALVYFLPIVCLVILLAKGRMDWVDRAFRFIFRSRLQFVLMTLALVLAVHYIYYLLEPTAYVIGGRPVFQYFANFLNTNWWPLTLIVLIAWLMPTQNRKTPKRA
jgi:hypothetical protein